MADTVTILVAADSRLGKSLLHHDKAGSASFIHLIIAETSIRLPRYVLMPAFVRTQIGLPLSPISAVSISL